MGRSTVARPEFVAWAAWFNTQLGRHGWNGVEFGQRAGVAHSTISRWRRALDRPRAAMAPRIASAFGVDIADVLAAAGFLGSEAEATVPGMPAPMVELSTTVLDSILPLQQVAGRLRAIEARMVRVAVLGESASADASRLLASEPAGDDMPTVWVPRSALGGLRGVGLTVVGTCLAPVINDGDVIVVGVYEDEASIRWRDGDYVAAVVEGQEGVQVKRLSRADNGWELRPEDGGPALAVTPSVRIVGRVVQSGRLYA